MILPTAKDILLLNYSLAKRKELPQGVADINLLRAALLRPQSCFRGSELYPDLYTKAASLGEFIIKGRPFKSANTSTALAVGLLMLRKNDVSIKVRPQEVALFAKTVRTGAVNVETLARWFRSITVSS